MPGLDPSILRNVNFQQADGRILTDIRNDMILSPHYSAIFAHAVDDLNQMVETDLRSGNFHPELPITMEVPKANGLTRPGSILTPKDRLLYQILVDTVAPNVEGTIDRNRVFSNIYLDPDPNFQMFESSNTAWQGFQSALQQHCQDQQYTHAIRTDVANYFERVKHHALIGLLRGSQCPPGAVNLLEEVLMAWTERTSFGILQGMFPSDYFGNYYLSVVDSSLSIHDIPSIRYVDDLYLFFNSSNEATKGLIFLISELRKDGLSLNDSKTQILQTANLLKEETEIDRLFAEAWEEVEEEIYATNLLVWSDYGFQGLWALDDDGELEDVDFHSEALLRLYEQVEAVPPRIAAKIEKFCLPLFAASGESIAVERCIEGLASRPHMASLYSSYLSSVEIGNTDLINRVEDLFQSDDLLYETQIMALSAYLIQSERIGAATINHALTLLRDTSKSFALRGLMPLLIGKHGSAIQRRNMRNFYTNETSSYVHAAILFATRYFPSDERIACRATWGNHTYVNRLVVRAMQNL